MPSTFDTFLLVTAKNRKTWRAWLQKNHASSGGVWLVYYKKSSGKPSISYGEAVREAICFGWIDSKVNSVDAERYKQVFTPRKPNSVWSRLNKTYVTELEAAGLLATAGKSKIAAAKKDGSWASLDAVENLTIPADLEKALTKNKVAQKNFLAFPASAKKIILYWITSAKQSTTRQTRINETVRLASQNIRANQPGRAKQ